MAKPYPKQLPRLSAEQQRKLFLARKQSQVRAAITKRVAEDRAAEQFHADDNNFLANQEQLDFDKWIAETREQAEKKFTKERRLAFVGKLLIAAYSLALAGTLLALILLLMSPFSNR